MEKTPNPQKSYKKHSSLTLNDISNFKTPKNVTKNSIFSTPFSQKYFTALKTTPCSKTVKNCKSKVEKRVKRFKFEQSKSARKKESEKVKELKSLSKAVFVWVNYLLENPESCGCDLSTCFEDVSGRKRGSPRDGKVQVDNTTWRCPKRQKSLSKREEGVDFSYLEGSLKDLCSFDDLKERMNYVNLGSCDEVFVVMAQVTKTIDEGRLQMKAHCPIVTDVGLKEKAFRTLMSYNPEWLRVGLYIIFGGDSLLPEGEVNTEEEIAFLKMIIDKEFFSHSGLARNFAYNKLVDGLYRSGYYESLGNIILKRFLLLVLILDRAKSQSYLPIEYGIDGLDGGSPLLFTLQSNIKSSSQLIHDFLSSNVMHGEGNVLAHLAIVGYKVSHQQSPLNEYDFKVTELFEDFCDGVRLCRVVQLLQHDTSLLMKMVVPSDTHKKKVVNCGIALKYLKQAGVPCCDEDGMVIEEEDIISGDKELTLSLLWSVFVHLQLPLLINRTLLQEEISRIRGVNEDLNSLALLDMLLKWMQAICENYDCKIDDFASLVDGKAMWCLLDYYFRKELKCSCSHKDLKETSIMSFSDYTDAVHNFLLSQKLTTLLGNFPEVLEVSDVLEHNGACSSKSVIILLVFLSFQLIVKKNTDQLNFHKILGFSCQTPARKGSNTGKCSMHPGVINQEFGHGNNTEGTPGKRDFKAIMTWWQDMAMQNKQSHQHPVPISQYLSSGRDSDVMQRENGATRIQSYFRKFLVRKNYLRRRNSVVLLQTAIRAWLVKKNSEAKKLEAQNRLKVLSRCTLIIADRRKFVKLQRSVTLIQHAVRAWIRRRHHDESMLVQDMHSREVHVEPASFVCDANKENVNRRKATVIVQRAWRKFVMHKGLRLQHLAATKIQSCYRFSRARKNFLVQKQAAVKIQSAFRSLKCSRSYQEYKVATRSAMVIQSYTRGLIARRGMHRLKFISIRIQSHWRGYLMRREFLVQKEAVLKMQNAFRSTQCRKLFHCYREAATEIQKFIRGHLVRRRFLGASLCHRVISIVDTSGVGLHSLSLTIFLQAVVKLQRWWKDVLMQRSRTKAALIIQSHTRGRRTRKEAAKERLCITLIQRWWRCAFMQKMRMRSAIIIQAYTRRWLAKRKTETERHVLMQNTRMRSAITIQSYTRRLLAMRETTKEKHALMQNTRIRSAVIIQTYTRRWLARQKTEKERHALMQNTRIASAIIIQSYTRLWLARQDATKERHVLMQNTRMRSAIIIQSYTRRWLARREATKERHDLMQNTRMRSAIIIQSYTRRCLARQEATKERHDLMQNTRIRSAIIIQSYTRRWLARREAKKERHVLMQNTRMRSASIIQSYTRRWLARQETTKERHALMQNIRIRSAIIIQSCTRRWLARRETIKERHALMKNTRIRSAITIQAYTRGWLSRRVASRERHRIAVIQSYWKGFLARKDLRGQLLDLRLRVQKSAANVDDGMRIMNRLLTALSDLLNMKTLTGILHTCKTLDMATQHSQKCCEKLVEAGAIDTLLKLIRSISRSVPDQEVLKYALSTLRNLARYAHLVEEIVATPGSVTTIFLEFLRNKEDPYFVASELLKKIFSNPHGNKSVRSSPAFLKRLHNLVEDLKRQACNEKRNTRGLRAREQVEKRLGEAAELLKLITNS